MGYWDTHPVIENPVPAPYIFVPSFLTVYETYTAPDGTVTQYPLNNYYFADAPTALWIAQHYGDGNVYYAPFLGPGGPTSVVTSCACTKITNGPNVNQFVNCGILAEFYDRNPEKIYPGLAELLIKQIEGITFIK